MIGVLQQNNAQVCGQVTCEALLGHACHLVLFISKSNWKVDFFRFQCQQKGLYFSLDFLPCLKAHTYHHVLHEMMIMSVNRCSDVLYSSGCIDLVK